MEQQAFPYREAFFCDISAVRRFPLSFFLCVSENSRIFALQTETYKFPYR